VPEPTAALWARGVRWRVATGAGIVGTIAQSEVVAGGGVPSVIRLGVSASQGAGRGTLEPGHAVLRFLP
jgi:hypothetical protein